MKLRYLVLLELAKHSSAQRGSGIGKIFRARAVDSIGPHSHQSAPEARIMGMSPLAENYDQTIVYSIALARMSAALIPNSNGATQEPAIITADLEPEGLKRQSQSQAWSYNYSAGIKDNPVERYFHL